MAGEIKTDIIYNLVTNTALFIEGMDRAIHGLDDLDRGMQSVEKNTSFLNQTLSTFVANLGVKVVEAATRAFGILKQGFDQFVSIAKDATMQAARIEVQWRTLSLTAGNAGQSIEDMTKHVEALRAAGIKTSEAIEIVTQFLANELPVENITELARRAQDMAVVIGRDSTEAFQRFNWFLQTGNSEWIRTMGITKTANQMLSEYAETQGKVVKALTDRERKEALVQGLMKETLRYEGAYEEAMKDPYKRWTSLPRLISNVTEVLGAVFVPLMGTVVDIASDALEKLERLFRVTKKEAKETGATIIGEWKEGFLKLRAVVQAFADWFMSIWGRVTGGFNEAAEGMMDRFVNAIIRGVQIAADALRRFATFIASIFGGTAPSGIAAETVARTAAAPAAAPTIAPAAPAVPAAEPTIAPAVAEVAEEAVAPPSAEDIARYGELAGEWAAMTEELARATNEAAEARERLAEAEEWLEEASEKVYDLQNKIAEFMLETAEIPERFTRGRQRQLEMELMAAEEEEHERQKAVEDQRELLDLAEEYERTIQDAADAIYDEMEALGESIAEQAEAYDEWLGKLQEAQAISLEEPVQAIVNQFESLDDLTAGYLEEIEGELAPAFASIETSVQSIVSSIGAAWEKAKGLAADAKGLAADIWGFLTDVKDWFDNLPDWAKNLLKGAGIAVALNFLTGGAAGETLKTALFAAFKGIGLLVSMGTTGVVAGALVATLAFTLWPLLDEDVRSKWREFFDEVVTGNVGEALKTGAEAAQAHLEGLPVEAETLPLIGPSLAWGQVWLEAADEIVDGVSSLFRDREPEIEGAVSQGVEEPVMTTFERLAEDLVGFSVVPEMVQEVVAWFEQMTLDLTPWLDQLTSKFNVLAAAIKGMPPIEKDLLQFDSGQIRITTVNLQGSTFGGDLSEWQVKDWMYEAIGDLV